MLPRCYRCSWWLFVDGGRFRGCLTMHAHHPGEGGTGGAMRGALALYMSSPWERGERLILFESAFCHVLYRSTNKTQVLD